MKITNIQIELEPNQTEATEYEFVPVILKRDGVSKTWKSYEFKDGKPIEKGLHPSEIDLIYKIQSNVISVWSNTSKKE